MRSIKAALLALLVGLAVACTSNVPPPSPVPTSSAASPVPSSSAAPTASAAPATASPRPTPPPKVVGDLELEMCDPEAVLPCEQQAVLMDEPVIAAGVSLTYSTEWADGRLDRPRWNADSLGLGGWSLDVLQRYDPERGILLAGDGSWRFAEAVDVGNGERAVPTFDGFSQFVFDEAWRHIRTVDSVTGITVLNFTYDGEGRLSEVHGHQADAPVDLTVQRFPDGTLNGLIGRSSIRTGVSVDASGMLGAVGRPDSSTLLISYAEFGLLTSWQETGRGATTYEFDASGRVVRETDGDGVMREFSIEKDDAGVAITTRDANGGAATLLSARVGDVLRRTFTDSDGTVTELDTNADGSTRLTEPDGTITTTGAAAHPRWGMAAPLLTPLVETRPSGTEYRVETTTDMGTRESLAAGGVWQTETVVNGSRRIESYDPASRTLTSTDANGLTSVAVFDELGRLVVDRVAGEPPVALTYDSSGHLASVVVGEGESSATYTYSFDEVLGALIEQRPDGTTAQVIYDASGNIIREWTDGENVSLTYDPAGDIIQVRPGRHLATALGYSNAGRETAFIPPAVGDDAAHETTTYTPAGQVATVDGPGERLITMTYDAAGRATSWTFDRGTSTATYGPQSGLLDSNLSPDGVMTEFTYDGWVRTGLDWSGPIDGEVRRTVDGLLRPVTETVNGGDSIEFGYDAAGSLTSVGPLLVERDPNTGRATRASLGDVATAHEYDANGRLVATVTTLGDEQLLALRYTRDAFGRVTAVERTAADGSVSLTSYTYDAAGRLASVDAHGQSETYAYDESGNRVSVTRADAGAAEVAAYDDRDRLIARGDETYGYDPDGTLLSHGGAGGTTTYDFDDLGALRSVLLPDGRRIDYVIDAGGRRLGRMVDGVLTDGFLYGVDDTIVAWTDAAGQVVARFAYDDLGRLALVRRDGRDLSVVTDQVGSPIALVDGASGDVVEEISYDAWGNVQGDPPSGLIPFGFAGGLLDPDTGLIHFGARDYDPSTGRWTAPDPLRYDGGDANLYRYASGDPLNLVDPTGTVACAPESCATTDEGPLARPTAGGKRGGSGGGTGGGTGRSIGGGKGAGGKGGGGKGYRDTGPAKPPSRPGGPVKFPHYGRDEIHRGDPGWWRPPGPGCNFWCWLGEPHVITGDGLHLDLQVAGEFIIARSPDGAFEVQGRFETPGSITTVTRVTAVALRVGTDRVAYYNDPERNLVVNGEVIPRTDYGTRLPGGGVVELHGPELIVTWPDGSTLHSHDYGRFLNFQLAPSDGIAGSLVGVSGGRDGDESNDVITRDGLVIDQQDPAFTSLLHDQFADSWRIVQEESLFDYLPGETTATFQRLEIPTAPATIDGLDEQTRTQAEALCRAAGLTTDPILSDCILDFGVTADPTYVGGAAVAQAQFERGAAAHVGGGTPIVVGQSVTGEVEAGATARYSLATAAGQVVYLEAQGECVNGLSWRLLRPDGVLNTFSAVCNDLGRRVLREAGSWGIEVYSDSGAGGPYAFRVIGVPPVQQANVTAGQSVSGEVGAIGEWDRYTLTATAGQVVYLEAQGECVDGLWWRLLRPDGVLSTFSAVCNDLGRRVLDVAGDWAIEVYSEELATGAYAFRIIDAPPVQQATVTAGQSVSGEVAAIGEWDRYTLTATAGQVVYLEAQGECVDGLWWRLLRPDGVLSTFAAICNDLGRRVLDVAGDWAIEVYSDELATGAYAFQVIAVPTPRESTIAIGQAMSGNITSVGEWHRYTLDATAGQVINLDAQGECVEGLAWRLLRPDGVLSTSAAVCQDLGRRELDVAGPWAIEVYSDGFATGSYAFRLDAAP